MTFVARSPCAKTISLARNLLTFLPRPAESRNDFTSKVEPFETFSWGERRAFADLRRVGGVGIGQTNTETTTCSMLCRLPYTKHLIAIARPCCHCFAPPAIVERAKWQRRFSWRTTIRRFAKCCVRCLNLKRTTTSARKPPTVKKLLNSLSNAIPI